VHYPVHHPYMSIIDYVL